jgi:transposase-like protein
MSERMQYWSRHLAAIEREGITTRAYAQREGLSVGALYQWRRELKARGQAVAGGGFVAVQVAPPAIEPASGCRLRLGAQVVLELSALPSAQWVAGLGAALAGALR